MHSNVHDDYVVIISCHLMQMHLRRTPFMTEHEKIKMSWGSFFWPLLEYSVVHSTRTKLSLCFIHDMTPEQ